jgi:hypothetical protein
LSVIIFTVGARWGYFEASCEEMYIFHIDDRFHIDRIILPKFVRWGLQH